MSLRSELTDALHWAKHDINGCAYSNPELCRAHVEATRHADRIIEALADAIAPDYDEVSRPSADTDTEDEPR